MKVLQEVPHPVGAAVPHTACQVVPAVRTYIASAGVAVEENLGNMGEFIDRWASAFRHQAVCDTGVCVCSWTQYLELRNLPRPSNNVDASAIVVPDQRDGITYRKDRYTQATPTVSYPDTYGVVERDEFIKSISHYGWGDTSGFDGDTRCSTCVPALSDSVVPTAPIIALDGLLGTSSWEELCTWTMMHRGDTPATGAIAGAWYGAINGYQGVPRSHYTGAEQFNRMLTNASTLMRVAARD